MVSNIYEQIVKEYYELTGYLTRSNIKGPRNTEIDLLAIRYSPLDKDYEVVWAETRGSGGAYLTKEDIYKKFSSELENIAIELTGKHPQRIFYVYGLPDESICAEVKEENGISMILLEEIIKSFIRLARRNIRKGKFPFSPASPLRSFLQSMIDLKLL